MGYSNSTVSMICSKHYSNLHKSLDGHSAKLLPVNIHYTIYYTISALVGLKLLLMWPNIFSTLGMFTVALLQSQLIVPTQNSARYSSRNPSRDYKLELE